MNRCVTSHPSSRVRPVALAMALAGALATLAPLPAAAQAVQRNFPKNALRGKMEFIGPPDIVLNGKSARLSPGCRIHGPDNMLVMSGQLAGTRYVVDYTWESPGNVNEVWMLTPAEADKSPWPRTLEQAANWSFDYMAQTWTKP
jgi:hypothetical protein